MHISDVLLDKKGTMFMSMGGSMVCCGEGLLLTLKWRVERQQRDVRR